MKNIILTFLISLITIPGFGQVRSFIDFKKYEVVDSLPLERITIHFNKEVDDDNLISLGDGDYLAPLPHNDKMIILTNKERTKAVVLYNSYCFGRHLEFDIQENERRIVLYHKDNNLYCGYIYDKAGKVCKYFESKKEFNRFMKHRIFKLRLNDNRRKTN